MRTAHTMTRLILFDMDQTLVDVLPYHTRAYTEMFKKTYGIEGSLTGIKFWGKTAPNIIMEICEMKGIPQKVAEDRLSEAIETIDSLFENLVRGVAIKPLRGAKALLESLRKTDNLLGVLTGSLERTTQAVLRASNLAEYFSIFVYGSEGRDRVELVGVAISRAERKYNIRFSGKDLVIIGDSIYDIECGKPYNAMTIAVATGFYPRRVLEEHKPDYLFDDLTDAGLLKILTGS